MFLLSLLYLFLVTGVKCILLSDEANARLPRLFHLDDHDRCLLQKDGLYCLGVFELFPIDPSPTYDYIQAYSSNPFTFNRSRLHRGYCVSSRCPSKRNDGNATLRFERCVDERAQQFALSARLHTLHYCTTHRDHKTKMEESPDSAQQLFIQVLYAVIVLNIVGTVYDVATEDSRRKNGILMAWSVRSSWRRLTATFDDGDPRLKELEPIHGLRVLGMLLILYGHCNVMHFRYFTTNPVFLENMSNRADGVFIANGTSIIQVFAMVSAFLTSYNMLLYSQKRELSFLMLPVLIFKRIIRIAPVHLLLVGYVATWWPHDRLGALSAVIGENSEICRRKFWSHVFFLNNVVDNNDMCLAPSWYIPVDMHLYIVTCILTIIMSRRRQLALRFYVMLFIISVAIIGIVNYLFQYQEMVYCAVPENTRGIFRNVKSFSGFYTSSWGSLPACFLGLFMAHLHYELQLRKYKYSENKWLKRLLNWCFPVTVLWTVLGGSIIRQYKHPLVVAAYVTMERPLNCCSLFFLVFGVINVDGSVRRFFGWKGWRIGARLSLPVMLGHWLVNEVISARPAAYHTSSFDLSIDYLAVVFYTHLLAVPISLLVEIPVQRFFRQLI